MLMSAKTNHLAYQLSHRPQQPQPLRCPRKDCLTLSVPHPRPPSGRTASRIRWPAIAAPHCPETHKCCRRIVTSAVMPRQSIEFSDYFPPDESMFVAGMHGSSMPLGTPLTQASDCASSSIAVASERRAATSKLHVPEPVQRMGGCRYGIHVNAIAPTELREGVDAVIALSQIRETTLCRPRFGVGGFAVRHCGEITTYDGRVNLQASGSSGRSRPAVLRRCAWPGRSRPYFFLSRLRRWPSRWHPARG